MEIDLRPEPTIFVGRNGFGKTNLLESLFYLATLRSHRVSADAPLVRTGAGAATSRPARTFTLLMTGPSVMKNAVRIARGTVARIQNQGVAGSCALSGIARCSLRY